MRTSWLLMGSVMLAVSACDNDPGEGKSVATVNEPTAAVAAAAVQPAGQLATYAFSNTDSKVEFVGAKVTGKHDGSFGSFTGTVKVPEGKPDQATINVEIATASLTADDPKLTGHLKSGDFFDVEKFPTATFTSTSITPSTQAGATHVITGNLQLHGVTKSISFPATVKLEGDTAESHAEFVINRKDFGLDYPGMPDDLIKEEVLLKLHIRAKKSA